MFKDERKRCGGSPDGLCADNGLEIKCPMPKQHIKILTTGKLDDYMPQCQFLMWVCGYDWWDLLIYTNCDRIPNTIYTIKRDPVFMDTLDAIMDPFCDELDKETERLESMGAVRVGPDCDIMDPKYDIENYMPGNASEL